MINYAEMSLKTKWDIYENASLKGLVRATDEVLLIFLLLASVIWIRINDLQYVTINVIPNCL